MITKKSIRSRAPTRIDLAGGTLDIWPLYLFLKDPTTLNLAIDLYAEATVDLIPLASRKAEGRIFLKSEDQNQELTLPWKALDEDPQIPPTLVLHFKLLKYFFDKRVQAGHSDFQYDLKLSTLAKSPAGAGLGGSSTLSIAMIGALATWASNPKAPKAIDPKKVGLNFIEIVRDVETTVIKVPAGLQDYYGAMYGGLQCLRWGPGVHQRDKLSEKLIPELEKRLLLFYSGQSRNSGINNWVLFKDFVDRQKDVQSRFQKISDASLKLEAALKSKNWKAVGESIAEEWKVRKTLAPGITTPEIDQAFREAEKIAPISGKVCGAGGGGCFFVYIPSDSESERSELKNRIQQIFSGHGMRPLPFHGVKHGLEVRVKRG